MHLVIVSGQAHISSATCYPPRGLSMFYVVIADGELDQLLEGYDHMLNEVQDLRDMGCHVRCIKFDSMAEAQTYADNWEGY